MNRFRSRKKSVGDGGEGSRRPSIDNENVPALPSFSSRTFRRKKSAAPEEPKQEIDLSHALPDTNDFRTSLLMPNLSARFSMLREQDDPTSKIGKANDDSVLFPKRASRLDLFNNRQQGLSDIAEVDSLRGSLRPPFTQARTDSYASDGYGTDGDGSVMSRSRPGEGNTMFGGRQKIYKIPVGQSGSVKNFGSAEDGEVSSGANMGGKALYESDTLPSAFQILREQERQERQERERAAADHSNIRSSHDNDRSGSPPMPRYNRNRETTSSTNSGPSQSRTSTAATSIASQKSIYGAHEALNGFNHGATSQPNSASSDRPFPRAKKLYGQGLEQNQHDTQSSSLQRINSLNRGRGGVAGRGLGPSRSASNLRDGYRGGYMPGGPLYSAGGYRSGSPTPSTTQPKMQDFDLGLHENMSPVSAGQTDSGYGASPQLFSHASPPISPNLSATTPDPTLGAALEPNDVGKATASGAFNKPKKQYDEQQYLKRQLQLHEGRNTPSPGPGAVARGFSPNQGHFNESIDGRSRNNSTTSGLSRSNSIMHNWEHQMEDRKMRTVTERGRSPSTRRGSEEPPNPAMERSFFGGQSESEVGESESEADPASPIPANTGFQAPQPRFSPAVAEDHPSNRPVQLQEPLNFAPNPQHLSQPLEDLTSDSRSYRSETTVTPNHDTPHQSMPLSESNPSISIAADSPTLGPVGVSNDLSGMVRQHLRNVSGTSSVYPEDSPRRSRSSRHESIFGHGSALDEQEWKDEISHDDHWVRRASQKRESEDIPPLPQPLHFAARQMLEQAQALKAQEGNKVKQMTGNDKAQRILGGEAPRTAHGTRDSDFSGQEPPRSRHARGPSTDTQRTGGDKAQRILGLDAPHTAPNGVDAEPHWQDQLKSNHARGPSTETQMERESLANELEARKRAVRSNLQTFAEGQSRDASPAPSAGVRTKDNSPARPAHPFSILKKSTSRSAMDRPPGKQENPSKAMKMLGIDPNAAPGDADGPPAGLFMGREQFSDRAMPPMRNPKQPQQDVRQNFDDESPSKRQRALFGSRSRQTTERPSPSSSKTGSSFSDSSDRHPSSRKGSKDNVIPQRSPADAFAHSGAGLAGAGSFKGPPPPGSPGNRAERVSPIKERSRSASRMRSRSNSKPTPPSQSGPIPRVAPPGTPIMINPANGNRTISRASSRPPSPPPLQDHPINHPAANHHPMTHPTMINPHPPPSPRTQQTFANKFGSINNRNRHINKDDISEPTFVSCTSSVDTVSLPPGASLSNGMDRRPSHPEQHSADAPPVPQRDSRRKRNLLAALSGRKSPQETVSAISSPIQTSFSPSVLHTQNSEDGSEVRSPLSADDEASSGQASPNPGSRKFYDKARLRKTSSDGGNMNQRARLQALQEVRPGLPYRGPGDVDGNEEVVGGGEHIQYQAERDVPASAVMF